PPPRGRSGRRSQTNPHPPWRGRRLWRFGGRLQARIDAVRRTPSTPRFSRDGFLALFDILAFFVFRSITKTANIAKPAIVLSLIGRGVLGALDAVVGWMPAPRPAERLLPGAHPQDRLRPLPCPLGDSARLQLLDGEVGGDRAVGQQVKDDVLRLAQGGAVLGGGRQR